MNRDETYNYDGLNMSAEAIPNLDEMLDHINDLLECTEEPHMKQLQETDKDMFERIIINKYHDKMPFKIIRMLMEPDRYVNLDKLLDMFETLKKVKRGEADVYDEFKKFNEKQNEQYVYPKFGGKEEFYKKMSTVPEDYKPPEGAELGPEIIVNNPNK